MLLRSGWPISSSGVVTKPSMEHFKRDWSHSFLLKMINILRPLWRYYMPWITTSLTWNTMIKKKLNRYRSRPEQNEKPPRQVLHKKTEIMLSSTAVENLDTLVLSVSWNIPPLRITGAFVKLCNNNNKMKWWVSETPE